MLLLGVALRSGLALRRGRLRRSEGRGRARARHLRFAKPAVGVLLVGAVAGPFSWVWFRGGEAFETFHGFVGATAALLLIVTALLGRRLEAGRSRAVDAHALAAALAVGLVALAAAAGMAILP